MIVAEPPSINVAVGPHPIGNGEANVRASDVKVASSLSSSNRRVLFVSDNFPPVIGGSAVVYHQLCRHNPEIVVGLSSTHDRFGWEKTGARDYDLDCGFRMIRFSHLRTPMRKAELHGLRRRFLSLFDEVQNVLILTWKIWRLCEREGVSVVCIGELISLGWLVIPLRYLFGKKTIIYTHGEETAQQSSNMLPRLRGFFLASCHRIIAVSNFCKSRIVTQYNISPSKVQVISNGVDLDFWFPGPRDESLLRSMGIAQKRVVFSAGRHVRRKGFDLLISAFPDVLNAFSDAHLLLAGDGPLTPEMKSQVEQLGIAGAVTFAGLVSNERLRDCYRSCDLFIMPNRSMPDGDTEGFGLVFLEASACGKAVISGVDGGVTDAVSDEESGLSVDASDPSLISQAIVRLLRNDDERARMGEAGLSLVRSNDWRLKSQEFRECLDHLVDAERFHGSGQTLHRDKLLPARPPAQDGAARFLVTVDTEEVFDWSNTFDGKSWIGDATGLRTFQEACDRRQIKPTYLLTYRMLKSLHVVTFLRDILERDACCVGIHLHTWNTPPLQGDPIGFNTFQNNLSPHLERNKLKNLCSLFRDTFGHLPRIHRAGRYGIGVRSFALLEDLGFKVDLSPSPGFDFGHLGGPNFVALGNNPFWAGSDARVLCLPTPAVRLLRGPDLVSRLYYAAFAQPRGVAVRFAPEGNPLARLKLMADLLLSQGLRELIIALHSTSLEPGGNPYSRTRVEAQRIHETLFALVDWLIEHRSLRASTPDEIQADYATSRLVDGQRAPRSEEGTVPQGSHCD